MNTIRKGQIKNVGKGNFQVTSILDGAPAALVHWISQPLRAAQALFHETTHQKAPNLAATLSIFKEGYELGRVAPIEPFWHAEAATKGSWPVDRSFLALHYYVHSIPFYYLLEEKWVKLVKQYGLPAGQEEPGKLARQGVERASFLYQEIRLRAEGFLDRDGLELLEWLGGIITRFT